MPRKCSPPEYAIKPAIARNSVVFPLPFGPSIPVHVPSEIVKSRSDKILVPERETLRPDALSKDMTGVEGNVNEEGVYAATIIKNDHPKHPSE